QMVDQHIASGAKATVAAVRQPLDMANQFGVIETRQDDPQRIARFVEKPASTPGLPDDPNAFLASMGNYVFDTDALVEALNRDAENPDSAHDMGGDIIPSFVADGAAGVYDFTTNEVPGDSSKSHYWRDVGTLDSYYEAHLDLVQPWPAFNLYNREWPLYTRQSVSPPAKLVRSATMRPGSAVDSILAQGVVISGGTVGKSVVSTDCRIGNDAWVEQCVLLDSVVVGEGAHVRHAILDKNVIVPPGVRIGFDRAEDEARGFTVTESGLTVVAKNQTVPAA
ncbi:MAG: sugar phosphate nucleotidyltransferase, partial [Micrococcus sp.]|nr:sugar phosphate nucleotidyltransferase [Micrococcus sp.]